MEIIASLLSRIKHDYHIFRGNIRIENHINGTNTDLAYHINGIIYALNHAFSVRWPTDTCKWYPLPSNKRDETALLVRRQTRQRLDAGEINHPSLVRSVPDGRIRHALRLAAEECHLRGELEDSVVV